MTGKSTGWRVSSYTTGQGNCVEVGQAPAAIVVRDTKNRSGVALRLPPAAWDQFITTLRAS